MMQSQRKKDYRSKIRIFGKERRKTDQDNNKSPLMSKGVEGSPDEKSTQSEPVNDNYTGQDHQSLQNIPQHNARPKDSFLYKGRQTINFTDDPGGETQEMSQHRTEKGGGLDCEPIDSTVNPLDNTEIDDSEDSLHSKEQEENEDALLKDESGDQERYEFSKRNAIEGYPDGFPSLEEEEEEESTYIEIAEYDYINRIKKKKNDPVKDYLIEFKNANTFLYRFIDNERAEIETRFLTILSPYYKDNLNILSRNIEFVEKDQNKINILMRKLLLLLKGGIVLSPAVYNMMAFYLLNTEFYEDGIEVLEESMNINNNPVVANNLLGILWFRLGDYYKARQLFEENLGEDQLYKSTCYSLGLISSIKMEYKKCIDYLSRVEEDFGNEKNYLRALGLSYKYLSQDLTALSYLENYLKKMPGDHEIILATADILYDNGKFDQAAFLYEKLKNEADEVVFYRIAVSNFFLNNREKTEIYLINLLDIKGEKEINPDDILDLFLTAYDIGYFDKHFFDLLYRLLQKESNQKKIAVNQRLGNEHIAHRELFMLILEANLAEEQYDIVLIMLEKAFNAGEQSERLLRVAGKAFLATGQIEKAFNLFMQLQEKGERDGEIYFYLGKIYFYQGLWAKCIKNMHRAIDKDFFHKDSFLFLGFSYFQERDFFHSVQFYKKYISYDNTNLNVLNDLGIVYSEMGDYENALKTFQSILRKENNNKEAHYNLAKTYKLILERASEKHLGEFAKIASETK